MVVRERGGERGGRLLNRPRRFYRFPLSPPWRTSDLSWREDEGETRGAGCGGGGVGDKGEGLLGEQGGTS